MSETKHTPGPWFTQREGFSTVYVESRIGGGVLQEVAACGPTAEGSDQQEANARLIAAAPELLQALYTALCFVEDAEGDMGYAPGFVRKTLLEIRAVIQKAEGKS